MNQQTLSVRYRDFTGNKGLLHVQVKQFNSKTLVSQHLIDNTHSLPACFSTTSGASDGRREL